MFARAVAVSGGTRMAGAFIRNVQARPTSPAPGASNTSATVSLQGIFLDPFRRTGGVIFQVDRVGLFTSAFAQTSAQVNGVGWSDTPLAWASAAIANGSWYYRIRSSGVRVGGGPPVPAGRYSTAVAFLQAGGEGLPRSLYLYVNKGVQTEVAGVGDNPRSLYLYVNKGTRGHLDKPHPRSLYLYVNKGVNLIAGYSRSLYVYRNARDGEVFPWLMRINPDEQYELGQVDLYGDGFGQFLEARDTAAITVSSTNGGNIGGNVRDSASAEWQSTSGASAWIRFTWGAAKRIVGIVLEGNRNGTTWGVPRFRFDDASSQDGGSTLPAPAFAAGSSAEYPVGGERRLYWLATPKTSTYVEVAIASGGGGTNRGFSEVWILEEIVPAQNAETARAVLNLTLPSEQTMGIASWMGRSPNLHPANGGQPILAAATVTVPTGAVSGLVYVEETT